jgi:hypothetical protein
MHRSGRSAALNFRNHFGGHSMMVAVIPRKPQNLPKKPSADASSLCWDPFHKNTRGHN